MLVSFHGISFLLPSADKTYSIQRLCRFMPSNENNINIGSNPFQYNVCVGS
jgi:hypothetical protein